MLSKIIYKQDPILIGQYLLNFRRCHVYRKQSETQNEYSANCDAESFNVATDQNFRINDFNIQMLSKNLYDQLFGENKFPKNQELIDRAFLELKRHSLPGTLHKLPDINLKLPPIYNNDIEHHFYKIGEEQCAPYRKLIQNIVEKIPTLPNKWKFVAGWTKYIKGKSPISVEYPDENALIFDIEVCVNEGQGPTLATAVSETAWYCWVSKDLINGCSHIGRRVYTSEDLIPLETSPKESGGNLNDFKMELKIVVGHSISYDRARIKEQYWLERTGMRFLDTMALHVCVSGVTSYQKSLLRSESSTDDWSKISSLNSLDKVHKLYCGTGVAKEERDIFVNGRYKDVIENFQSLTTYCAKDVIATHGVLVKLWPLFLDRFSHPVTLAGMLELGTAYLPVNENWNRYIEDAHQSFDDLETESKVLLTQQADKACQLLHKEQFKSDLWLWDQDWQLKQFKLKKEQLKKSKKLNPDDNNRETKKEIVVDEYESEKYQNLDKFNRLINDTERLPIKIPYLAGYPEWYRELCSNPSSDDWEPGPQLITASKRVTPKLLRMSWKYMPLHYVRNHGWGQLVPFKTNISLPDEELNLVPLKQLTDSYLKISKDNPFWGETIIDLCNQSLREKVEVGLVASKKRYIPKKIKYDVNKCCDKTEIGVTCGLLKLPHKNGDHLNVGNPLSKDFVATFTEDMRLNCCDSKAAKIIEISHQLSYWKNNRERIENQLVVWLENRNLPDSLKNNKVNFGSIIPQVLVCGTLTRRAVERTWMTASNATDKRIGSELRCMVQAPEGYNLIGADVDSQELWIASLIGDSHFAKEHGCTAFGWMTISGDKSDGTDMHSVTAKTMGISRTNAKIINYARIYGAGQNFAERLLRQFIPDISPASASLKASKMFQSTKGKRIYELKENCFVEEPQRTYTKYAASELCKMVGKSVEELFHRPKWVGGSESAMFNRLEEIASSPKPVTPFLHCRLSRALEPLDSGDDDSRFIPTKINWVVQSGAVDFLHLMLVCMRWLINPKVRFCLSFHDEIRYLVPENQKYETALALHVTNLLTRAFCIRRLGMVDMPQSVAFFSSVEVDTVLRKDASDDCRTPSNPYGLSKGYNIPLGESLDILTAIKKSNGIPRFLSVDMKKHIVSKALDDNVNINEDQSIVKIVEAKGNSLYEIETTNNDRFLVSLPSKYRNTVWVKRGNFVIIEDIKEGNKVKGEIVKILLKHHIKNMKRHGIWPESFNEDSVILHSKE